LHHEGRLPTSNITRAPPERRTAARRACGDGSEPVALGRWQLLQDKGSNLPLDVPGAGRYRIELRAGNAVPPRVRVQRMD